MVSSPTIPVSPPLIVNNKLHVDFPCVLHLPTRLLMMRLMVAAPLPASIVLVTARATTLPSPGSDILACEPPLNAKNPKNRMKPPKAESYGNGNGEKLEMTLDSD